MGVIGQMLGARVGVRVLKGGGLGYGRGGGAAPLEHAVIVPFYLYLYPHPHPQHAPTFTLTVPYPPTPSGMRSWMLGLHEEYAQGAAHVVATLGRHLRPGSPRHISVSSRVGEGVGLR